MSFKKMSSNFPYHKKETLCKSVLLIYVRFIKQLPVMSGRPDEGLSISYADVMKVQRVM